MQPQCQDDSYIKRTGSQLYRHGKHSNRSAPDLVSEQAPPAHGFRVQLNHLLPRHAYFRARLQIHQISNIPLVSGGFSVRWKFKNVHSPPRQKHGILSIVKGRSRPGTPTIQVELDKRGKSFESGAHNERPLPASSALSPGAHGRSSSNGQDAYPYPRSATALGSTSNSIGEPSTMLSPTGFTFLNRPSPLISGFASPLQSLHPTSPQTLLSPDFDLPTVRARTPTYSSSSLLTPKPNSTTPHDSASAARGQTAVVDLKDHSVVWHHTVTTALRLDVSRDSGILAPSQLKLAVVQHPVRNDPASAPQNPRFGAVYLNMAEFADKGCAQRKYLLKETKINAILHLTIELEHIGGTTDYKAPPLPKGEIMNGITSLLERDIYNAEKSSLGGKVLVPTSRQISQSSKLSSNTSSDSHKLDLGPPIDPLSPFDVESIPKADGASDTQALIDALFNPAVTTEKEKESPFTVYVSQREQNGHDRLDVNPKQSQYNLEASSMYSTASSNEDTWTTVRTVSSGSSVATSAASSKSARIRKLHLPLGSSHHGIDEVEPAPARAHSVKGWFKKRVGSRPTTPTCT